MMNFPSMLRHGSGTPMTLDRSRLLIELRDPPPPLHVVGADLAYPPYPLNPQVGAPRRPRIETRGRRVGGPVQPINHTERRIWLRSRDGQPVDSEALKSFEREMGDRLVSAAPVYQLEGTPGPGGSLCPFPDVLLVKLAPGATSEALEQILRPHGWEEDAKRTELLTGYHFCRRMDDGAPAAWELRQILLERDSRLVRQVHFENMPMVCPIAALPNDTLYAQQWNMQRIHAGGAGITGWDLSHGNPAVILAILDTGCDLTHPDLTFFSPGANIGPSGGDGAPRGSASSRGHGTCCAGVAAATYHNALGVAGVAGDCRVLPVAFENWTDAEVAAAINYAVAQGAQVLSMSFGMYGPGEGHSPSGWNFAVIDPAIQNAVNVAGCVLVAATGNENLSTFNRYPARHPLVMAIGASDEVDDRKSPASPDGEWWWGSNFADGVSLVAPGVHLPSTDIQSTDGYNNAAGTAGDFYLSFGGTSGATPHVAGAAGLLFSLYPGLTHTEVRQVLEQTAERVGPVAYTDVAGYPNGPRNQPMGYGRLNVLAALDCADLMIKDYPADIGVEPSTPPGGDYWDFSDIVVRPTDDGVFNPADIFGSKMVEKGQPNYVYVRVTNRGPRPARNVTVNVRITPWVGVQFVYPNDWTAVDANHVSPTPVLATFANLAAGATALAKFRIETAQADDLWDWQDLHSWHPCLLAEVDADNDYARDVAVMSGSALAKRRNNLAQRNLSVQDVFPGTMAFFPFMAGNLHNFDEEMEIIIDRSALPREAEVFLSLDEDRSLFPRMDFEPVPAVGRFFEARPRTFERETLIFPERTRLEMATAGARSTLTLAGGSRLRFAPHVEHEALALKGASLRLEAGKRLARIEDDWSFVKLSRQPGALVPMMVKTRIPRTAEKGDRLRVTVAQRNQAGEVVGGATMIYVVR